LVVSEQILYPGKEPAKPPTGWESGWKRTPYKRHGEKKSLSLPGIEPLLSSSLVMNSLVLT